MWDDQIATVRRLWTASRRNSLEFLLEAIPSKVGAVGDGTAAQVIRRFYGAGIYPDWWKLEAQPSRAAWDACVAAIESHDPHTRGIVVLGLDAPMDRLAEGLAEAACVPLVKGFAVGRTIFGDAARAWLSGEIDDAAAVDLMAGRYDTLCRAWDGARRTKEHAA